MATAPLSVGAFGKDVAGLHTSLAKAGVALPASEVDRNFFGPATRQAVQQIQQQNGLAPTGQVDAQTASVVASGVDTTDADAKNRLAAGLTNVATMLVKPPPGSTPPAQSTPAATPSAPSDGAYLVSGQICLDHGLLAVGIVVRIYNQQFGAAQMLGETKTDAQGQYSLKYDPGNKAPNLLVKAVDGSGNEIALSETKFGAGSNEIINLVAPASLQPLAPEYRRLSADLARQLGNAANVANAAETEQRQDLSVLSGATGWDARTIALAATANKLSADTGIPHDALYAAFRAGLPSDAQSLAQVGSSALTLALAKAGNAGIVDLSDDQVAAARTSFEKFARTTRLAATAPGTQSSFGALLDQAGLQANDRALFEAVYVAQQDNSADLWQTAKTAGVSQAAIDQLQVQGKLAFLTLNHAPLAGSLQKELGASGDLTQLVDKDLHKADTWKQRLNDGQAVPVPPAYAGTSDEASRDAYAADMARKVRVAFPTHVVKRMIESDELSLGSDHQTLKAPVATFLQKATSLGFEFGTTPANTFIAANRSALFAKNTDAVTADSVANSVKTLQRLFQITPSNDSLSALSRLGFASAHDVARFSPETFLERFGGNFPSLDEARLVHRKAQQVHAVTLNVMTMARQIDSTPPMFALAASTQQKETSKANLIKAFPTMESLFGSLDFCQCTECRSVLSPAAYLVDLLKFIDPDDLDWSSFKSAWAAKHGGVAYDAKYLKPYDALVKRRADLPHLPLTCENTNTVLPYIDVVNEVLEYFVAHSAMDPAAAYDTGAATTAELLAEPQNIIPSAYDVLAKARYPLTLPFDLWIAEVRRFYEHFQSSLATTLETFRANDGLNPTQAAPNAYGRAAVFIESLGISPAELAVFTSADTATKWYELYGFASASEATTAATDQDGQRIDLNSAKALSRRLGITYLELAALLKTAFVNPQLEVFEFLRKLNVDVSDVFRYKNAPAAAPFTNDEQAFAARLTALTELYNPSSDPAGFDAAHWLDSAWTAGSFKSVLQLADPDSGCNFDQTILRFADGTPADALSFLKINLFVRLWRKLQWTMEEVDAALQVFLPANSAPLSLAGIGQALNSALLCLAHLNTLTQQVKVGKDNRSKLLVLWGNLRTTGRRPLYAQLFLTRSVLNIDAVFDDPLGRYLSQSGLLLEDHLVAVQAALSLASTDIGYILEDIGSDIQATPLSLATVSQLYRYGLLAKALKLSIKELISLKQLSGLNPFAPLSANPIADLSTDYPFTQTIRFVELAGIVKASGFKLEDLDYLLRHEFDPVGKYRQDEASVLALIASLAVGVKGIRAQYAIPADPLILTDDMIRQTLALVLPGDVVETFLAMWTGTIVYQSTQPHVAAADRIDPAPFAQQAQLKLGYDDLRDWQWLTYTGVLLDGAKAQIEAIKPSTTLSTLLDDIQSQAKDFFVKYFQKAPPGQESVGFLDAADFAVLFAPTDPSTGEQAQQQTLRQKRSRLASAFLPFLQHRLIRQFAAETMTANLGADPAIAQSLLELVRLPNATLPVLDDVFAGADQQGLTAIFYSAPDGSGAGTTADIASADTASLDVQGNRVTPAGTNSVRFQGFLSVPASGPCRFFASADKKNTRLQLRFDHLPDALIDATLTADGAELSEFTNLSAGIVYHVALQADNLAGGNVKLLVRGQDTPKDALSQLTLYPQSLVDRITSARLVLEKANQLIQALSFNNKEVQYLIAHASDFSNFDFGVLPTANLGSTPQAVANFSAFIRLANYAALKAKIVGGSDDLIDVFANSRLALAANDDANAVATKLLADTCTRVADLTRRDVARVQSVAASLGFGTAMLGAPPTSVEASAFTQEQGLMRLWAALQLAEQISIPVDSIVGSTGLVNSSAAAADRAAVAQSLRNAVKARYEPEAWQAVAPSIFDRLRQQRRDALVGYILHGLGLDRPEQLFEYFLIDPQMEPVVQTSRLRLAISSLQTFIQRCLLNLEPQVSPDAIDAAQWQWMKRYRVWEANRKIFLFPENWLEPEFRDDKTYMFKQMESALLQNDITNDSAEDAFFAYLQQLEQIARLDMVAMYREQGPIDPNPGTLHVIGRTYSDPHKYFYRRYAYEMWTPWEPIDAGIEGDHVVAVVWRGRLNLFWITFMQKSSQDANADTQIQDVAKQTVSQAVQKQVQVQLNWSEYFQGAWTTRESSGFGSEFITNVPADFDVDTVFVHASKELVGSEEAAIRINLGDPAQRAFRVVSRNCAPALANPQVAGDSPYPSVGTKATLFVGAANLRVSYTEYIGAPNAPIRLPVPVVKDILSQTATRESDRFTLLISTNLTESVSDDSGETIPLHRLRSTNGEHFYTTSSTERDNAIAFAGYVSEGVQCNVSALPVPGAVPLYRMYSPTASDHFYTWDADERTKVIANNGYKDEGIACYVYTQQMPGTVALYRLNHLADAHHFYTTSTTERDQAVATEGFAYEATCYVYPRPLTTTIPLIDTFFYQDDQNTFLVEPSLSPPTLANWNRWSIDSPPVNTHFASQTWWNSLPVASAIPLAAIPKIQIDPNARFRIAASTDWTTSQAAVLKYNGRNIGASGVIRPAALKFAASAASPASGADTARAASATPALTAARTVPVVVGGTGLNPALLGSLIARKT